jgi:hypothetical protein
VKIPPDTESPPPVSGWPARIALALLGAATAALVVVLLALGGHERSAGAGPTAVSPRPHVGSAPSTVRTPGEAQLTVTAQAPSIAIPRSFLGLSTEYWTLPVAERHIALYGRVLELLHVPGDGPFILRIGGDSSDHTFYDPGILKMPRWAFDLTPVFVARTAQIVRDMNLHVILDLNLITAAPALAAAWAREAEVVMPKGSIIGYEVGNEPDLYSRSFWLLATEGDKFASRVLPKDITPANYAHDFNSYARVLSRAAPDVPLYAPALANPFIDLSWIKTLLAGPHPGLRVVTAHKYPYSACAFPGTPGYPTISRLLSEEATAGMAQSVKPAVELAHRAGLQFRLTEINSVTCGGRRGVSNSFATALWAPDAIFELMKAGVAGVNLHARVGTINTPFTFTSRGLLARPLLYGLILFARILGPDARLVTALVAAAPSQHVKAWVVRVSHDTLHVLLLDKGRRSVAVTMNLPAKDPATVERLLARSPRATSGETLGGQHLDANGNWRGKAVRQVVAPHAHRYVVTLPRYSAALVTVHMTANASK